MSGLYNNHEEKRVSGLNGCRPEDEPGRTAFRKDYSRLLHTPAFRRLQGKTQLLPGTDSDFFRNRLTHSLEVAQIAQGIAAKLNAEDIPNHFPGSTINEDIVQFAGLAHDLGHPPFGHNGEYALDEEMRDHGGFEGNAQTLRILSTIEQKLVETTPNHYSNEFGLDLTLRSLASVLKYSQEIPLRRSNSNIFKGYYFTDRKLVDQIKNAVAPGLEESTAFKTIECSIMDIADDIAYSTYDLDDTLHAGILSPMRLVFGFMDEKHPEIQAEVLKQTNKSLEKNGEPATNKDEVFSTLARIFTPADFLPNELAKLIQDAAKNGAGHIPESAAQLEINLESWNTNQVIQTDSLTRNRFTSERVGRLIRSTNFIPNLKYPSLSAIRLTRDALLEVEILKHLNYELVISSPQLSVIEYRGRGIVKEIFQSINDSSGKLLPIRWRERYAAAREETGKRRVICDYIACMTDRYAANVYARLHGEGASIFTPHY